MSVSQKTSQSSLLRIAVYLLEGLVDRDRADRHRRVAHNPFTRGVDVPARGEVHHGVGAPTDGPHHLLDFFGDRRRDGGELPMFALIFTRKLRPMSIGSSSGWFTFAGMMARPDAISERTNSGVTTSGIEAPKLSPSTRALRPRFSRAAA